ncbi:Protein CBG13659 [Caenorhabditis briggsae]|uniref:Protein CBG13659 n=1 Tax=Caenorhabditis briggsae TaxID=6238 RepID=A8XIF2_CAEBR|nr:Protein CBG13659 [Caenorhabditis briggsae]CAP32426.2 Protein CBG13659 [Caenorhabditis briggsae]
MSDSANAVIAILDECLNEGRFNFDTISERVEDIVNLGLVVRDYNYDEPIDELQDLKGRIEELLSSLENPGDDSLENLRAATEQNAPLELVYKLETMLEQKHANPIIAETDQDTLYMLDAVFGELLFVEAYINGLLDDGDMYRPEKIQEIVNEFHEDVFFVVSMLLFT